MKKLTKILSIILALSMMLLALASCDKKLSPEERLDTALAAIDIPDDTESSEQQTKADLEIDAKGTVQMYGITLEVPVSMNLAMDVSDKANPEMALELAMTIMGESTTMKAYFKDGYTYSESDGIKTKSKNGDTSESEFDISDLKEISKKIKDEIKSAAEYTENDDGTLTVKTVLKTEKLKEIFASYEIFGVSSAIGDIDEKLSDIEITLTIDKENKITNVESNLTLNMNVGLFEETTEMKVSVSAKIEPSNVDMNITVEALSGTESTSIKIDLTMKMNPIGDDFKVTFPDDLDSYVEVTDDESTGL